MPKPSARHPAAKKPARKAVRKPAAKAAAWTLTALQVAQQVAALVNNQKVPRHRMSQKGTRLYYPREDGEWFGGNPYVEIRQGVGMAAATATESLPKIYEKALKQVLTRTTTVTGGAKAPRSGASGLGQVRAAWKLVEAIKAYGGGMTANVWTKKGVRVYIDDASGGRGYLEVKTGEAPKAIRNRSSYEAETISSIVTLALGHATVVAEN